MFYHNKSSCVPSSSPLACVNLHPQKCLRSALSILQSGQNVTQQPHLKLLTKPDNSRDGKLVMISSYFEPTKCKMTFSVTDKKHRWHRQLWLTNASWCSSVYSRSYCNASLQTEHKSECGWLRWSCRKTFECYLSVYSEHTQRDRNPRRPNGVASLCCGCSAWADPAIKASMRVAVDPHLPFQEPLVVGCCYEVWRGNKRPLDTKIIWMYNKCLWSAQRSNQF